MGKISIGKITDAIIDGIETAHEQYEEWSGGDWLTLAPEYLITSYIAEKIGDIEGAKYITLESGVKRTMSDAGALSRGRLSNKTRPNGRFDILLWKGNEEPRAIVEVKNAVYTYRKIKADIQRTCEVLSKNSTKSSLQFGVIAFCTDAEDSSRNSGKDILENRLALYLKRAKQDFGESFDITLKKKITSEQITSEQEWHRASACILFK